MTEQLVAARTVDMSMLVWYEYKHKLRDKSADGSQSIKWMQTAKGKIRHQSRHQKAKSPDSHCMMSIQSYFVFILVTESHYWNRWGSQTSRLSQKVPLLRQMRQSNVPTVSKSPIHHITIHLTATTLSHENCHALQFYCSGWLQTLTNFYNIWPKVHWIKFATQQLFICPSHLFTAATLPWENKSTTQY